MSKITLEDMMDAERRWDEGGNKDVPTIIAEAVLAERQRWESICQRVISEYSSGPWDEIERHDAMRCAARIIRDDGAGGLAPE